MGRLKFLLIGLFVMLAVVATISAYASSNQAAFVSAATVISVDFGNVFPGTVVTQSFTITSTYYSAYNVTMLPPSDTTLTDMRPYLTAWEDPSDPDHVLDVPVGGPPNYTPGTGAFTASENNLSDTWFVSFSVPDVTLAEGAFVNYGCEISIDLTSPPPGG